MLLGRISLFLLIANWLCFPSIQADSPQNEDAFILLATNPLTVSPEEDNLLLPPISEEILDKTSQEVNLLMPYKGDDLLMPDTYYKRTPQENPEPVNLSLNILKPEIPSSPRLSGGIITYKDYKRDLSTSLTTPLSTARIEEEVLRQGVSLNVKT